MSTKSEDNWDKQVTNSKIARTIVSGGVLISFTLLITKDIFKGIKNIITKPSFRKKKNVRCSTDLH